jgi:hypothetical protein
MTTALTITPSTDLLPAPLFAPTPKAAKRFVEFFTAQINNDHTRKAYLNATRRFAGWCQAHDLAELADVQPFHVAAFVKEMQGQFTPPTVKQHLAALPPMAHCATILFLGQLWQMRLGLPWTVQPSRQFRRGVLGHLPE